MAAIDRVWGNGCNISVAMRMASVSLPSPVHRLPLHSQDESMFKVLGHPLYFAGMTWHGTDPWTPRFIGMSWHGKSWHGTARLW